MQPETYEEFSAAGLNPSKCYCRGANKITEAPTKQIVAPTQSYKSGAFLSIPHPHKIDRTINTPPYAA
jgi:hypothetical protein